MLFAGLLICTDSAAGRNACGSDECGEQGVKESGQKPSLFVALNWIRLFCLSPNEIDDSSIFDYLLN
jgi:hypothetical protein